MIDVVQLSEYIKPIAQETASKEWVLNGENNSYYDFIIDGYLNSPTNSAIIDSYAQMMYGLGLNVQQNLISKKDLRQLIIDFVIFGESAVEIVYKNKQVVKINHVPKQWVAPNKAVDGEVRSFWFSKNFAEYRKKENEPLQLDVFGFGNKTKNEIFIFRPYQVGQFYYSNASYLSALSYIKLEEEIGNYFVNHIQNGFSAGYIINLNNGEPEEAEKKKIYQDFKNKLVGSSNAGKFILSYNRDKESSATIEAVPVSDAHQQYSYLCAEAKRQICVAHKVVSPAMLGIENSTGFSSNAEQIETAFNETMLNVIQPKQEIILDGLEFITGLKGLQFIPLRKSMKDEAQKSVAMSKHETDHIADFLVDLGEEIDDEWEIIDEIDLHGEPNDLESRLNLSAHLFLAKDFASFWKDGSEQDTTLFKVRYKYAGNEKPERAFCKKLMKAGKVYRKEDIILAGSKIVNPGFGPEGADTYNIWLYHGGVNCKHIWQRVIYLRKGNKSISVNEARKMILELDPEDRPAAKWVQNEPEVATAAAPENNFYRLK